MFCTHSNINARIRFVWICFFRVFKREGGVVLVYNVRYRKGGFTLVELAIVLVIIGLIAGGVLVGQDLIKSAKLRSQITQIRSITAAMATFQAKYGGLPGDFKNSYGFAELATTRASNGDGLIQCASGSTAANTAGCGSSAVQPYAINCENMLFWDDLYKAGFSDYKPTGTIPTTLAALTASNWDTNAEIGGVLPSASLSDSSLLMAYSTTGGHYIHISNLSAISATGALTGAASFSPSDAVQIDDKMDDGVPGSGSIQAVGTVPAATISIPATCGTATAYSLTAANANAVNCNLRFDL